VCNCRHKTPYQIVLTKTDLVFPIDVARRAMEIQEVFPPSIYPAICTFQLINPLIELFMHSTAEPEEEQVSGKPSGELLNSLLFFFVCMRTLLLMNTLLSHTMILLHVDDGEL